MREDEADDGGTADDKNEGSEQQFDWSAYKDDEGRLYYYNSVTGESSWDAPEEGFNPPPPEEDNEEEADGEEQTMEQEEQTTEDQAEEEPQEQDDTKEEQQPDVSEPAGAAEQEEEEEPPMAGDWVEYKDDEGRSYYFNTVSQETTWDRPREFDEMQAETIKQEEQTGDVSPDRPQSPSMGKMAPESPMEDAAMEDHGKEEVEEEDQVKEADPAVKRLEDAKLALSQPDAIMENGTFLCS